MTDRDAELALAERIEKYDCIVLHEIVPGKLITTAKEVCGVEERDMIVSALRATRRPEPVGVVGTMPGTDGFTMACFEAAKVPVGAALYVHPAEPQGAREDTIEECIRAIANVMQIVPESAGGPMFDALRALKSSPPPERDAALPLREALEQIDTIAVCVGVVEPNSYKRMLENIADIARAALAAASANEVKP